MWSDEDDFRAWITDMGQEYKDTMKLWETPWQVKLLNGFLDFLVAKYAIECYSQSLEKHADPAYREEEK